MAGYLEVFPPLSYREKRKENGADEAERSRSQKSNE